MLGAIPPLLQYAFMAWRSVKAQGQIYFLLSPLLIQWSSSSFDVFVMDLYNTRSRDISEV
jgi:hypothetical protein